MPRKEYSDIAVSTTLVGNLAIGGLSLTLASAAGYPSGTYKFVIKIDDELVLCDGRSGTTCTVNSAGRGFSGTTAIAHSNGAPITHPWESNSATDLMRHVYDTTHDDHTQYQKETEKNTANGYAGLDSSGTVPAAQIDATIARDSEVAAAVTTHAGAVDPHGDRAFTTSAVSTHTAAVDPHGDRAFATTAANGSTSTAAAALTAHEADTTSVHGIANTGNLVLTADARLTDTRVPTDGSVTIAKHASEAGTAWTPTLAGTGVSLGNGTVIGIYQKMNRQVIAQARVTFGSTTTFGTTALTIGGLPAANNSSVLAIGVVRYVDVSNQDYMGAWLVGAGQTSGEVRAGGQFAVPDYLDLEYKIKNTIPFGWVSGDYMELTISYIANS